MSSRQFLNKISRVKSGSVGLERSDWLFKCFNQNKLFDWLQNCNRTCTLMKFQSLLGLQLSFDWPKFIYREPRLWYSGQRACLVLWQSEEFESRCSGCSKFFENNENKRKRGRVRVIQKFFCKVICNLKKELTVSRIRTCCFGVTSQSFWPTAPPPTFAKSLMEASHAKSYFPPRASSLLATL